MKLAALMGPLVVGTAATAGVVGTFLVVGQWSRGSAAPVPAAPNVSTSPVAPQPSAPAEEVRPTPVAEPNPAPGLSGTYRCWSFNVGGSGSRCTSPPITLNADGTYAMSSERGTYTVAGGKIVLSESKIRGPGTLSEDQMRMTFEYTYNGLAHTVTYLKPEAEPSKSSSRGGPVYLDLTIRFDEPYDSIDGVTAVQLVPAGGGTTYEALAYATDDQTLKAYFKPQRGGIPSGSSYTVFVSFGSERLAVGQVDLLNASGEVSRTIRSNLP